MLKVLRTYVSLNSSSACVYQDIFRVFSDIGPGNRGQRCAHGARIFSCLESNRVRDHP